MPLLDIPVVYRANRISPRVLIPGFQERVVFQGFHAEIQNSDLVAKMDELIEGNQMPAGIVRLDSNPFNGARKQVSREIELSGENDKLRAQINALEAASKGDPDKVGAEPAPAKKKDLTAPRPNRKRKQS